MILLYEIVSTFEDIWIECLKDLERYRMTIEDNHENRNIWSDVVNFWNSKVFNIISTEIFSNSVSINFFLIFESQSNILVVKLEELLNTKKHENVSWNQKKETQQNVVMKLRIVNQQVIYRVIRSRDEH